MAAVNSHSQAATGIDQVEATREPAYTGSLFSNQDPWTAVGNASIMPPRPNKLVKEPVISGDQYVDGRVADINSSNTATLLEEGFGEENIKQQLQAVAEGVAASVLQSPFPEKPAVFSGDHGDSHGALADAKVQDEGKNQFDKTSQGVQVLDDIENLQIIKNSDLEELRELGSGTFGTVYHGKWRGTDVAIKRINDRCFAGKASEQERMRTDFWNEAEKLASLHHPNVVAFYGVVVDGPGGSVATVTEYMANGSLRQALQRNEKIFDRRRRLLIAMDVAFGMEYLHGKNIVHFDLKSDNLLVNLRDPQRPICKVGDLGLSKVKCQTLISGGVRGTLPWMAPELLNGSSSLVSEKVDVFSFGIVMWELLTGEEPYAELHYGAIIGGIVNNTLRPPVPESCDPQWRSLMEQCWSSEPSERPSFTQIGQRLRDHGSFSYKAGKGTAKPIPKPKSVGRRTAGGQPRARRPSHLAAAAATATALRLPTRLPPPEFTVAHFSRLFLPEKAQNCRAGASRFALGNRFAVAGAPSQIRFHSGAEMPQLTPVDATLILDHVLGDPSVPAAAAHALLAALPSPSHPTLRLRRGFLLRRLAADPLSADALDSLQLLASLPSPSPAPWRRPTSPSPLSSRPLRPTSTPPRRRYLRAPTAGRAALSRKEAPPRSPPTRPLPSQTTATEERVKELLAAEWTSIGPSRLEEAAERLVGDEAVETWRAVDEATRAKYRLLVGPEKSNEILSKLEEASSRVNPISTPEVHKVVDALQTSCADLHKSVEDPLPTAKAAADKVLAARMDKAANMSAAGVNGRQTTCGTAGLSSLNDIDQAPNKGASSLMDWNPTAQTYQVGDLGLSKVKCQTLISGGVRGTLPWMAPELLNGSSSLVSEKVDVFSFGIVMWELLTGEEPYAELHYGAIIGGIVNNTLRPPVPESCDPQWRSLMEQCWSSEPSERPSFTQIGQRLRTMAASPTKVQQQK
ncbi:hypothetical protein PR202_gb17707 [Eleusine coracana subsp. coracana]|uniref:Protein kinase domain-containing protein n=1 Tax=Eleusine coracana subsp. coracana TaxID=191504 RepID=A0AAV5F3L0_ELECO|nr:hypothetical protein PR202_gb17707 [Eleusine coracana subsp. coracana]